MNRSCDRVGRHEMFPSFISLVQVPGARLALELSRKGSDELTRWEK